MTGRSMLRSGVATAAWIVRVVALVLATQAAAQTGGVTERAWSTGSNVSGQLGRSTSNLYESLFERVGGVSGVTAIAAGGATSVALRSDGTVWLWGGPFVLGGRRPDPTIPVQVPGVTKARAIAVGNSHALAVREDGTTWSWGINGAGALGDGTTMDRRLEAVRVLNLHDSIAAAGGNAFSLVLRRHGTVVGFGLNNVGQLGTPTPNVFSVTPVEITGLSGVTAIAAGSAHGLALREDGSVVAWGHNSSGQLGDGTLINHMTPLPVPGLLGVVAIAAGSAHSLALKADGTVWAWGNNGFGQLGDGTSEYRFSPVPVVALPPVVAIAAGDRHSLALLPDGTVMSWGAGEVGQLGDGSFQSYQLTPGAVPGLSGATAIAGGGAHSLAMTSDPGFTFIGFSDPIENLPVLNEANAGRTVPVKFSLEGNQGLLIVEVGSPATEEISCATGGPVGSAVPTTGSLTYDAHKDEYTYSWDTDAAWVGTCRQLTLQLTDGYVYQAIFAFR